MKSDSPCFLVSPSPCLFYFAGIAAGAAAGWLAATCQLAGWAPVGLLSLGIGCGLGWLVSRLAAIFAVDGRKRLIVGTLLFALVTVFAEHAWLYRDFRRQWAEDLASDPRVAIFRSTEPWTPVEYFQREASPGWITLWVVDAALIVGSALIIVLVIRRHERLRPLTSDP